MSAQDEINTCELYQPRPSPIVLGLEIILHLLVGAILIAELSGWILVLALLLFVLLAIRFFRRDSTLAGFPPGCSLSLNAMTETLTWRQHDLDLECPVKDSRVIMSRWFVLLQFGRGCGRLNKLLLADSFGDINRYTRLRRQIKDIYRC